MDLSTIQNSDATCSAVIMPQLMNKFQSLPLEIRHHIYTHIVHPPNIFKVIHDLPCSPTDSLRPIACTCKTIYEEIASWYKSSHAMVKKYHNLTQTKQFGYLNLDIVTFEITIDYKLILDGQIHHEQVYKMTQERRMCSRECDCSLPTNHLLRLSREDLQPIRRLKLLMTGEDHRDSGRYGGYFSTHAIQQIIHRAKSLEDVHVYLCWGVNRDILREWQKCGFPNQERPYIPTCIEESYTFPQSTSFKVTMWWACWRKSELEAQGSRNSQSNVTPVKLRVWSNDDNPSEEPGISLFDLGI